MPEEKPPSQELSPMALPNAKLVASKERWAQTGRLLDPSAKQEERLPPGQRLVKDWPVLDLGIQPHVRKEEWSLLLDGLVDAPKTLDFEQFQALPQVEHVFDIHCVTQWSRYDNRWQGVATHVLVELVKLRATVSHVMLESYDGYTTNVSLADFLLDSALLAHSHDGAPLSRVHGGPVRLVIPHLYFWKSAKWLRRITFLDQDAPGFWEKRGYHMRGDPWLQQRYA
jgi:DMSO/TMAO reductase YedYZ molybdopterin-dependent catalytic subunit